MSNSVSISHSTSREFIYMLEKQELKLVYKLRTVTGFLNAYTT